MVKDRISIVAICRTILTSLEYSRDNIASHPYREESQRHDSMKPIEEAIDCVRWVRDRLKEESK